MGTPERFTDMAAVRRERERLLALREERANAVNAHWDHLREPAFQKAVMGNLARGVLRSVFSWSSAKQMAGLVSPEMIGGIAGLALGGRAKSKAARMLVMGLSAAIPFVAKRMQGHDKDSGVLSELDTSWERIKAYVRERRDARRERRADSAQ